MILTERLRRLLEEAARKRFNADFADGSRADKEGSDYDSGADAKIPSIGWCPKLVGPRIGRC